MTPFQRQTAAIADKAFSARLAKALRHDSAQDAVDAIEALRHEESKGAIRYEKNGCTMAILRAIDDLFYLIHPRAQFVPPGKIPRKLPRWLCELRDRRLVFGEYSSDAGFRLIARGPLVRRDRGETASNAENFADYFTALTVVPSKLRHRTRELEIDHSVIGLDGARGVAKGRQPGAEQVVFIPIAEQANDLHITERQVKQQKFADFWLRPDLDAAETVYAVLNQAGPVDIAFAPEFVISEAHADKLALGLHANVSAPPRIIVAGSGQTIVQNEDKQVWNESRILNGIGCELWRQRKIWPAGVTASLAKKYGLSDPGDGKLMMEDSAQGDTLAIADVDGMGRCVVLICQDIHLSSACRELLDFFQPDWVFVPILDTGVTPGRWAHQETFANSGLSAARFMIVSSTALAKLVDPSRSYACALAVGPKAGSAEDGDDGRAFQEISVAPGTTPGYGTLQWRSGDWQQTVLGAQAKK